MIRMMIQIKINQIFLMMPNKKIRVGYVSVSDSFFLWTIRISRRMEQLQIDDIDKTITPIWTLTSQTRFFFLFFDLCIFDLFS